MPPATGQGCRQLGLGKLYSAADVDHDLDFTQGTQLAGADAAGASISEVPSESLKGHDERCHVHAARLAAVKQRDRKPQEIQCW
jgi:hypothetical protein